MPYSQAQAVLLQLWYDCLALGEAPYLCGADIEVYILAEGYDWGAPLIT